MTQVSNSSNIVTPYPTSWRAYGLTISSNHQFANKLMLGNGTPDLTLHCTSHPQITHMPDGLNPVYESPYKIENGESIVYLYQLGTHDLLHCPQVADFHIWQNEIVCHIPNPVQLPLMEIRFLGSVCTLILEQRGMPALHASAVSIEKRVVGFLSNSHGGKSSLAASFLCAGHPLITDDILFIERKMSAFFGRPGYPQIRLWPDQAIHFHDRYEELEPVYPGYAKLRIPLGPPSSWSFCDEHRSLACLYIPERRIPSDTSSKIEITSMSPRDALIELVRYSFAGQMIEAAGWRAKRLDFFAQMVRQIPLRRLVYPSGFEHLPSVRRAILDDLAQSS